MSIHSNVLPSRDVAAIRRLIDQAMVENIASGVVLDTTPDGKHARVRSGSSSIITARIAASGAVAPGDTVVMLRLPQENYRWIVLTGYTPGASAGASTPTIAAPITELAPPAGFEVTDYAGLILVSWQAPAQRPDLTYEVAVAEVGDEDNALTYFVSGSYYLWVGEAAETRAFRVRSVTREWIRSGWSAWKTGTVLAGGAGGGVTDHGALTGLADDDHPQYHNDVRGDARYSSLGHNHDAAYAALAHHHDADYAAINHDHDARYYRENEHIAASAGAADAGKPIVLNAGGKVDDTMLPASSGNGVESFTDLNDTPDAYEGMAGRLVLVNSDETGVLFHNAYYNNEYQAISSPIILRSTSLSSGQPPTINFHRRPIDRIVSSTDNYMLLNAYAKTDVPGEGDDVFVGSISLNGLSAPDAYYVPARFIFKLAKDRESIPPIESEILSLSATGTWFNAAGENRDFVVRTGPGYLIYGDANTGWLGLGRGAPADKVHIGGAVALDNTARPSVPAAGVHKLYAKADGLYVLNSSDVEVGPLGIGGSATDHGALAGLADDDHPQYHTDARGDARYSPLGHTHVEADITDLSHDAVSLQGNPVAASAPSSGDVLAWDGAAWSPAAGSAGGGGIEPIDPVYTKWDPDAPPVTPSALDDEFSDGVLAAKWTKFDPNNLLTVEENERGLVLTQATRQGDNQTGIWQSLPAGDFTFITRVNPVAVRKQFFGSGLALYENPSDTSKSLVTWGANVIDTGVELLVARWNNHNSWGEAYWIAVMPAVPDTGLYLRLRRQGNTYYFDYSLNGISWLQVYQRDGLPFTPLAIGINSNNVNTGLSTRAVVPFFRYKAENVGALAHLEGRSIPQGQSVVLSSVPASQALFTFEGTLQVGASPLRIYNATGAGKLISKVFLSVSDAPIGAAIIVDVHKNGTTIFANQNDRPQIAASAMTGETVLAEAVAWAAGEYLTVEIDQAGSTVPGQNLVVHVVATGEAGASSIGDVLAEVREYVATHNSEPIDTIISTGAYKALLYFASHNQANWKSATTSYTVPTGKKAVVVHLEGSSQVKDDTINRRVLLHSITNASIYLNYDHFKGGGVVWTGDLGDTTKAPELAAGHEVKLQIWNSDSNRRAIGGYVVFREMDV